MYQLALQGTIALAIALIESFEGIEYQAYTDQVGVPTICAGLTQYPDGTPVQLGDKCSAPVCRAYLQTMLEEQYVPALIRIPGWDRLGKCRKAALLSFAWNMGPNFYGRDGFESITSVLARGAKNPEAYDEIPSTLAKYVYANGRALEGLRIRREEEGRIWQRESDGTMLYDCNLATFLKKAPIPSKFLSNDGKLGFQPGDRLEVVAVDEIPEDSHQWVTLKESGERWALYRPHWSIWSESRAKDGNDDGLIDWGDFSAKVSKHLTVGEVLQWDSRRRPDSGSEIERELLALATQYDFITEAWGGLLGVTSGYRPEPINYEVGGKPGSFHTKGMALDIYPVGESCSVFHKWLSRRWSGGLGDGCNLGFVHIDIRDEGRFHPRADARPCCTWGY
jgi:GH24 family phage-related lysozyme (muramidase)